MTRDWWIAIRPNGIPECRSIRWSERDVWESICAARLYDIPEEAAVDGWSVKRVRVEVLIDDSAADNNRSGQP